MPKKTDDIPVVVKPLAYYKMLIHVLRYGSKNIDPYQCKEVMGGLIGHVAEDGENKTLIIEDAIPVSHGGTIEVKFDEEQMVAFAEIDQMVFDKHGDKMWFACGWYHSHPNISPFFSGTDILNQLFWQNNVPHNVGIVFDHAYLDKPGDLGFRTFRLDDPSKGMNSKFHEVETKVEAPSNVEYYDKFRELIYHIQTNQPPIKELNETSDYLGDIFIPKQEEFVAKKPELITEELISALNTGIKNLVNLSIGPLIQVLNNWAQEIVNKTYFNNSQMRKNLVEIRDGLRSELTRIQKFFNSTLKYKLEEVDSFVDNKLDEFDEVQEEIKNIVKDIDGKVKERIKLYFNEKLIPSINQIITTFNESLATIAEIDESNKEVVKKLENNIIQLWDVSNALEPSKVKITEEINNLQEKALGSAKKRAKNIDTTYSNLDKDTKDILSDLKAAILILEGSKDPIMKKIEKLENEKKNLHRTIQELKSEKEEILEKVNNKNQEGGEE